MNKRVLVELSHAIEQFALAAEPDDPLVVIALFQKMSYFQREAAVYAEIARRASVTIVGLVEDVPPTLPEGVRHALLGADDPLAREWSVTVLGPGGGATLVAVDQESIEHNAPTLEQGRQFRGRWSFRRGDAYREVLRLRAELPLPPSTTGDVTAALRAVAGVPELPQQGWLDAPLRFVVGRMETALRGWNRVRAELDDRRPDSGRRDPRTGLFTAAHLQRWTSGLGAGTLPVGLVVLRLLAVDSVRMQYGMRIEVAALQAVARALQELSGAADRVFRLDRDNFLVVMPGSGTDAVLELGRGARARVARMDQWYPFVALGAVAVATVTRNRPLPVEQLLGEASRSTPDDTEVRLVAG
jgi:GGDEF domain-containing protein